MELTLTIKNIPKIISQNTYLVPGTRYIWAGKKKIANHYLYKDPTVKTYQEYMESYLLENYRSAIKDQMVFFTANENGTRKYKEYFDFYMLNNIKARDVTNCVKLVEDSIVRVINTVFDWEIRAKQIPKFDDSQIYHSECNKFLITDPNIHQEYINYRIAWMD